eukprot:241418-Ditylum_brightwellii.AAC.1
MLKVAHRMHVAVVLLDCLIDLVLDEHIQVLDLSACQAVFLGSPFGVFNKLDMPEPLLLRNRVRRLNVLLAKFSEVSLGFVMIAGAM